ncbi:MAG: ArsR family transcriptional regulator [Thiobacillus sp.]|nr:ArsR family transcriptional regulator [Thiobacillus sp.]
MHNILQYLKDHGERLDLELAAEMNLPLDKVCKQLSELARQGEVIMCRTTRYDGPRKVEGMLCRAAGFIPPSSPGRRPKTPS